MTQFPEARTEPLSSRSIQKWTFGLLVRHFAHYAVLLTVIDLTTMYSLVAAVVFLVSSLSDSFPANLVANVPALPADLLSNTAFGFAVSGILFAIHIVSGWTGALLQRRFSVAFENRLKAEILKNSALWIAPRSAFVAPSEVERRITALLRRSRAVTRSARAMINILPSVIFLLTSIVGLLVLFPAALIWLGVMALLSIVVQKFANRRIVNLENNFAQDTTKYKGSLRRHVQLYSAASPSDEELSIKVQLDDESNTLSHSYFSRSTLTNLTRISSFGVMTGVSFAFLALILIFQPQMAEDALVETFVILLLVARTILSAIAGIAANQAVLTKYAYHAHQNFLYFHGSAKRTKPTAAPPSCRLIGPEPIGPHGISFYVDGLNTIAQADLRQYRGGLNWDRSTGNLVVGRGQDATVYQTLTVPTDIRTPLELNPGDVLVLYGCVISVRKKRLMDPRRYRMIVQRDQKRALARRKSEAFVDQDAWADEDDE
jgi:hypothetical protein